MKTLALAFTLVLACCLSFYAGVFTTSFNTNMCYSEVLGSLADEAKVAAASGDPAAMARYARLIAALPNAGYESDCGRIAAALKEQRPESRQK